MQGGFVALRRHAGWKLLINTDGHVASSRLGHLLRTNSVVLTNQSPSIEYYYRWADFSSGFRLRIQVQVPR